MRTPAIRAATRPSAPAFARCVCTMSGLNERASDTRRASARTSSKGEIALPRVGTIVGSTGGMRWWTRVAELARERLENLEDRPWASRCDVHRFARELRCRGRGDVRLDHVVDKGEGTRLPPVAVDERRLAAHVGGDEAWDRGR